MKDKRSILLVYHDGDNRNEKWLKNEFAKVVGHHAEICESSARITRAVSIGIDTPEHKASQTLATKTASHPALYAVLPNIGIAFNCKNALDKAIEDQKIILPEQTEVSFLEP